MKILYFVAMIHIAGITPALATQKACRDSEAYVNGFGCVRKTVVQQAVRNCQAVAAAVKHPVQVTECLCSDGSDVGACGD